MNKLKYSLLLSIATANLLYGAVTHNITIGGTTTTCPAPVSGVITATADCSISAVDVDSNLSGMNNLTIDTNGSGNIIVNDSITWGSTNNLILEADRNIYINADITSNNANGNLFFKYGQGAVATGNTADYNIARNVKINMQGGSIFQTTLGSDGTATNYTVVNSATALQNINNNLSGNFAIGADVDLSGVTWTSIGIFTGKFNGLGHTVSNLTLTGSSNTGLFGETNSALIRDIGIVEANVSATAYANGVGVLIGKASNTNIINTFSTGSVLANNQMDGAGGLIGYTISDTNISNSYSTVNVNGNGASSAGGLVGYSQNSAIRNSYAGGNISDAYKVGGLIGEIYGDSVNSGIGIINNTYAIGSVVAKSFGNVGGLVGQVSFNVNVSNSYSSGLVTGANGSTNGGVIGAVTGSPTTSNVYWDAETSGQSTTAFGSSPIYGYYLREHIFATPNSSTVQAPTIAAYTGFDFTNDWFMIDGQTRPFLRMEWTPNIKQAHELQLVSMNLANSYKLINDINLTSSLSNKSEMWKDNSVSVNFSDYKGSFSPISTFTGAFDGASHIIDSLRIDKTGTNVGFFGEVGTGANIKDVGLINIDIHGGNQTGGLAGYVYGTGINISRVFTTGIISSSQSGAGYGGLAGYIYVRNGGAGAVSVTDSYSSVNILRDSRNNPLSNVGGLVGTLYGRDFAAIVTNSYATGAITNITGGAGGLIGNYTGGTNTVTNSFWDIDTSNQSTSAGGTGKTTEEMKNLITFNSTTPAWDVVEDTSLSNVYPQLRWSKTGLGSGSSVWVMAPLPKPIQITIGGTGEPCSITNGVISGTDNCSVTSEAISTALASGDVNISNLSGGSDANITILEPISWSSDYKLAIQSKGHIFINSDINATGANGKVILEYGQGAVASGNSSDFNIAKNVKIYLNDGQNFSTKVGSDGVVVDYTVVNSASNLQTALGSSSTNKIALGSDLDFSGVDWTSVWSFGGKFTGLGHTISNFSGVKRGLFEYINGSSNNPIVIRDLGLVDVNITYQNNNLVGALIGSSARYVTIKNVYSTGTITLTSTTLGGLADGVGGLVASLRDSSLSDSYSTVNVTATRSRAGGLVSQVENSTISNSYASGNVSAQDYAGGLVAIVYGGEFRNVYAIGDVNTSANDESKNAGGLIGAIDLYEGDFDLINAFASGSVSGNSGEGSTVGGLIGSYEEGSGTISITRAYWDSDTTGQSNSAIVTPNFTNPNAYAQTTYKGFDFTNDWFIVEGYTRPFLRMEWTPNITQAHELQMMSMKLGKSNTVSYKLLNDINLTSSLTNKSEMWKDNSVSVNFSDYNGSFSPIGSDISSLNSAFFGSLDGLGHTIEHLIINRADLEGVGLFGLTGNSVNIKNIGLINVDILGKQYVGGFVGYGAFDVDNINLDPSVEKVTISNSYVKGKIAGKSVVLNDNFGGNIGGLVGIAWVGIDITDSYVEAIISGENGNIGGLIGSVDKGINISKSYMKGDISGNREGGGYIGGLAGRIDESGFIKEIRNSYTDVVINADKHNNIGGLVGGGYANKTIGASVNIYESFAMGSIVGNYNIGGLVGELAPTKKIENSYATVNITANDYSFESYGFTVDMISDAIGGLVGNLTESTIVTNSYSTGSILKSSVAKNVGGLIGKAPTASPSSEGEGEGSPSVNIPTITNSYWDVITSGLGTSGQTISSAGGIGKTTSEMKNIITFNSTTPAWDIVIDSSLVDVYPQLRWSKTGLSAGESIWVVGELPNSTPTDINITSSTIAENSAIGTLVGELNATDSDTNNVHTFSFCSGSDSNFTISGNQLKTAINLDYETTNSYVTCIRVSDGTATFDKNLTITITDVNESSNSSSESSSSSVSTNTAPIYEQFLSSIIENINFTDRNVILNSITDIDQNDLNITVDMNDTSIIRITPNWTNLVSYADYNSKELYFTIHSIPNMYGSVELNISINDGADITHRTFIVYVNAPTNSSNSSSSSEISSSESSSSSSVYVAPIVDYTPIYIEPTNPTTPTNQASSAPTNTNTNTNIEIVDTTAGATGQTVTMDNLDTGFRLTNILDKVDNNSDGSKSITVQYTNNGVIQERKVINSEIQNTVITSTKEGNSAIINMSATTQNSEVKVNSKINENGTTLNTITIKNSDGVEKSATIGSLIVGSLVDIKADGSVEVSLNDIKMSVNSDGKVSHTVSNGDKSTKATSEVPNSTVVIKEDGTVQTKGVVESESKKIEIVVDGKSDGKAVHILKTIDKTTGEERIAKAYSEVVGATTEIKNDGSVVTSYENSKAETNSDGFMTHIVAINGFESKATMEIAGAETIIAENGVTTKAETEDKINNQRIIAVVETDSNGENFSYFKRIYENGEEVNEQDTTKSKIAKGAEYKVTMQNGVPNIDVTTTMRDINKIEF